MYILTSKKDKEVKATDSFIECFEFITTHLDTRVRTIDYKADMKLIDKRTFLKQYLKFTGDYERFFELCKIMVKGTNKVSFLSELNLSKRFLRYEKIKNKHL